MSTEVTPTEEQKPAVATQTEEQKPGVSVVPEGAKTEPVSEPGEEEKKRRSGWQRRMDRLTRQRDEALEAAETEKTTRLRLEAQLAGKSTATAGSTVEEDPKPKEADFKDYASFSEALSRWAARQEFKSSSAKSQQTATQEAENARLQEVWQGHQERIELGREKYSDWDEIAEGLKDVDLPQGAQLAIMEAEDGHDVMYHLATHPDQLKKLQKMSNVRAAIEVGKISASLSGATPPKPKVTATPKPITPVGGGSTRSTVDLSKAPLTEYMKKREADKRRAN